MVSHVKLQLNKENLNKEYLMTPLIMHLNILTKANQYLTLLLNTI